MNKNSGFSFENKTIKSNGKKITPNNLTKVYTWWAQEKRIQNIKCDKHIEKDGQYSPPIVHAIFEHGKDVRNLFQIISIQWMLGKIQALKNTNLIL